MERSVAQQPVVLESTVEVERPIADVWAYLRNMENYVEWFPGIVQMKAVDAPPGVRGARYAEIGLGPDGKEHLIDVEVVVADDRNRHLAIEASLKPVLPRFDYRLTEIDAGRTHFHWRCVGRARGPLAAVGRQVMKRIVGPRLVRAMRNFKRILEANPQKTMRAVMFRRFGPAADATLVFPLAARPTPGRGEVLVRQQASSVNPIDCHRRAGYGRNVMRARGALEFPVTLGVDISGEIVGVGRGISGLKQGDAVFGVKPPSSHGAFADYVVVRAEHLVARPPTLDPGVAAALPYAFLTAWSALVVDGGLTPANAHRKRIFVQGGAGGVGSMGVQLAKAWGAQVTTSASERKLDDVRALGADAVIPRGARNLAPLSETFDIVLCSADQGEQDDLVSLLRRHAGARYVSVIHPTLKLTDEKGVMAGFMEARRRLRALNATLKPDGRAARWTLFKPHRSGLLTMAALATSGKLKPIIDSRFSLEQAATAQARLESGAANGKIIVEIAAPTAHGSKGP
jgi:NADPH:quinone reductase-like Zn-dependent oxidoreductase/carbon monoxide dehydrogenase subunit G